MTREEAIARARKWNLGSLDEEDTTALYELIPELRESEDERIRKSLIKFLTDIKEISESGRTSWAIRKEDAEMCKSFLTYLEKQKEHLTPEEKMNHPLYLEGFDIGKRVGEITGKPAEWSEKKEFISDMISERLKSLRPQPHTVSIKDATKFGNLEYERGVKDGIQSEKNRHWKPSEEQMEALRRMKAAIAGEGEIYKPLNSLYEQLKKLM